MGNFALFDAAEDKKLADFFLGVLEIESSVRFRQGVGESDGSPIKGKNGDYCPLLTPPRSRGGAGQRGSLPAGRTERRWVAAVATRDK